MFFDRKNGRFVFDEIDFILLWYMLASFLGVTIRYLIDLYLSSELYEDKKREELARSIIKECQLLSKEQEGQVLSNKETKFLKNQRRKRQEKKITNFALGHRFIDIDSLSTRGGADPEPENNDNIKEFDLKNDHLNNEYRPNQNHLVNPKSSYFRVFQTFWEVIKNLDKNQVRTFLKSVTPEKILKFIKSLDDKQKKSLLKFLKNYKNYAREFIRKYQDHDNRFVKLSVAIAEWLLVFFPHIEKMVFWYLQKRIFTVLINMSTTKFQAFLKFFGGIGLVDGLFFGGVGFSIAFAIFSGRSAKQQQQYFQNYGFDANNENDETFKNLDSSEKTVDNLEIYKDEKIVNEMKKLGLYSDEEFHSNNKNILDDALDFDNQQIQKIEKETVQQFNPEDQTNLNKNVEFTQKSPKRKAKLVNYSDWLKDQETELNSGPVNEDYEIKNHNQHTQRVPIKDNGLNNED